MSERIWSIENEGIVWQVKDGQIHRDDIEMSGLLIDCIVGYGVNDDGSLFVSQHCYFPTLRTIPNNTHATYSVKFERDQLPKLMVDDREITEYPRRFSFDGVLSVECTTGQGFSTKRTIFPSADHGFCIEIVRIKAEKDVVLNVFGESDSIYSYGRGTKGVYIAKVYHNAPNTVDLKAGQTFEYAVYLYCDLADRSSTIPRYKKELEKRIKRVDDLCNGSLVLKSGMAELDVMTRLAKLRAGESVFQTLSGKFHSPGGRAYYAAIWCNDQVEYAGPHFAMTGDRTCIEASINAYKAYIPFMSPTYYRIPSSIIAEGLDIWEGAGDRGDAAMYLYGASLFCLYLGDEKVVRELFPAIQWCAEYCERKKTEQGVISSDSDELEGRFPTDGVANLSTSSLCYGGLRLAAKLAYSIGEQEMGKEYNSRADLLEIAIEEYFGANLHGFDTYRYSKGFDTLRAWICLPLCVGIKNRLEGTLGAMLSPYLWTEEGMLTCQLSDENRSNTIWDRSTLYGFKCAFACGKADKMIRPLLDYCEKRLLCDRVPYAVEAYPEGSRRHLSGESALFVRIVSEGIFGIAPESLTSFSFDPNLSYGLGELSLSKIPICGQLYDIIIKGKHWQVMRNGQIYKMGTANGERVLVD